MGLRKHKPLTPRAFSFIPDQGEKSIFRCHLMLQEPWASSSLTGISALPKPHVEPMPGPAEPPWHHKVSPFPTPVLQGLLHVLCLLLQLYPCCPVGLFLKEQKYFPSLPMTFHLHHTPALHISPNKPAPCGDPQTVFISCPCSHARRSLWGTPPRACVCHGSPGLFLALLRCLETTFRAVCAVKNSRATFSASRPPDSENAWMLRYPLKTEPSVKVRKGLMLLDF